MQTLILVLGPQCSTRLATCNLSKNELIAKFARVSTSLKLLGIQYRAQKQGAFTLFGMFLDTCLCRGSTLEVSRTSTLSP